MLTSEHQIVTFYLIHHLYPGIEPTHQQEHSNSATILKIKTFIMPLLKLRSEIWRLSLRGLYQYVPTLDKKRTQTSATQTRIFCHRTRNASACKRVSRSNPDNEITSNEALRFMPPSRPTDSTRDTCLIGFLFFFQTAITSRGSL